MRTIIYTTTLSLALTAPALAQESFDQPATSEGRAAQAVEHGAFMPFTDTPAADQTRVGTVAMYDASRDRMRVDATAQVRVIDRLQIQGTVTYEDADADPAISAQYDVMQQTSAPIDLQLSGGFDDSGLNDVASAFATVSAGRTVAGNYLFGTARFDLGTATDEAGAQLGVAAVRPVGPGVVAGLDGQVQVDLERDASEPMEESSWAMTAGPVVSYTNDIVAVTASGGIAATDPRASSADVGAYGSLGLGVVF